MLYRQSSTVSHTDKYCFDHVNTSGFSHAFVKMRGTLVAELVSGEKECVRSALAGMALERLARA